MQIVIDIPDYSIPQNNGLLELQMMCFRGEIWQCSFPFKVLPKGHGDLIDRKDLMPDADYEDGIFGAVSCQQIVEAEAIIEADMVESEG